MDGLRWLLLLFGLLIVVAVYLYSRRKPESQGTAGPVLKSFRSKIEPLFAADTSEDNSRDPDVEPIRDSRPQKIVTLRMVAKHQAAFAGDELALTLRGIGMRHGKFGIFHRYDGIDESKSVFCAASLVEPGSFDLANLKEQRIPGISLFMVLPGPMEGAKAFDLMVSAARSLSQSLDADLLDESGSTLSIQRERYLREEVIQFEHEISVA
ncbi:MAG TPA: cell division protein ZipA C-terminal FtsZ-binding domain-containing protein [Woeseiaceae bacterium]|nr:cell division protein ZipA C-terminal FtsZ-binding domain-containing protein [Woeseiaceae bacterium]